MKLILSPTWWWGWLAVRKRRYTYAQLSAETSDASTGALEFVLPDPKDAPASLAQGAPHQQIPLFVTGYLASPERDVALGHAAVLRATVPIAAICENR